MKIAITGGTGFVGRRLVASHAVAGDAVHVLSRQPMADGAGVRYFQGDLCGADDRPIQEFLKGVDALYHCAGESRDTSMMRRLNVDGTRGLLNLAVRVAEKRERPIHWVQLSSVCVYGLPKELRTIDRVVTETTSGVPVSAYEVTRTESDRLVEAAAKSGALTFSILRPSKILGAETRDPSLQMLIKLIRKGMFFYVGQPGAIATYVHVDDVVAALIKCGTDARAKGQIYNLSSDCPLEGMIHGISDALGVNSSRIRFPENLVRGLVKAVSCIVPLPLTQERINGLVRRTTYSTAKIERELDFKISRKVPDVMRELGFNFGVSAEAGLK